ncbi:hypothetical protein [Schlesneria sp.]|uniref:hypothetical protein n=1 Tax=Schlesneria sp. TaxID=2762018 RepID=UPI002F242D67
MTATFKVGANVQLVLFSMRAHNRIMNDNHRETMHQIRTFYLPFHFMTAAYSRYPGVFAKRSVRWQKYKARTVHHQRPNEFTGELRRAVLTESVIRATATRGTLTAKSPQTSVVKRGPLAGKRIRRPLTEQRRAELEHVSDLEIAEQSQRMQDFYVAAIYDPANQDRVLKQFR